MFSKPFAKRNDNQLLVTKRKEEFTPVEKIKSQKRETKETNKNLGILRKLSKDMGIQMGAITGFEKKASEREL